MYNNINNNIAIDSDAEIISKIREIVEISIEKIKKFVKSKRESDFKVYHDLDEKFDDIIDNLENLKTFDPEFEYFLSVKDKILYIIFKNCEDSSFGHCDFAIELFNFILEILNAKITLIKNYSKIELESYKKLQQSFKSAYHQYRREFYWNVYDENFNEKEMYEFAKSLKGD